MSSIVSIYSQQTHLFSNLEAQTQKAIGCSKDSQVYHKACEHYTSAMQRKQFEHMLDRYLKDDLYRRFKSKGVTVEQGTIGAMAAKREHWSKMQFLKQTTGGGAGTVATAKHPDLQKAKEWHPTHFRRQRDNTPTQQHNSGWQWQDGNN